MVRVRNSGSSPRTGRVVLCVCWGERRLLCVPHYPHPRNKIQAFNRALFPLLEKEPFENLMKVWTLYSTKGLM